MRLLDIDKLEFREFHGGSVPPYIITSHRWCDDEPTYKDVKKKRNTECQGYKKIEGFCCFARLVRYSQRREGEPPCDYIWIDTCCIDKTSSAELSEAINSMCSWYRNAAFCCAYLADVPPIQLADVLPVQKIFAGVPSVFYSEWFKRGWTLQELLAPTLVVFVDSEWNIRGVKPTVYNTSRILGGFPSLNDSIAETIGIPHNVLLDFDSCREVTINNRMHWTAGRQTTRPEDMAYCLLGIFDAHLPLIYGEGAQNAMERLLAEIARKAAQAPKKTSHTRATGLMEANNTRMMEAPALANQIILDSPRASFNPRNDHSILELMEVERPTMPQDRYEVINTLYPLPGARQATSSLNSLQALTTYNTPYGKPTYDNTPYGNYPGSQQPAYPPFRKPDGYYREQTEDEDEDDRFPTLPPRRRSSGRRRRSP